MDNDKELYNLFLNGDNKSFETLILKYKNSIIYFSSKFTKNVYDAEDIFQDTVLYILQHKEYYNFDYSFKAYIFTITKSKTLDYLKKKKKIEILNDDIASYENLEDTIFSRTELQKVKELIKELPKDYEMAIYLTQIEKFSYKETAELMSKTENQVKLLIYRARKKLKKSMGRNYSTNIQYSVIDNLVDRKLVLSNQLYILRIIIIMLLSIILMSGIIYASVVIYKNSIKSKPIPSTIEKIGNTNTNSIWIGTFQIAWNELINELGKKVEFENYESDMVNNLNQQLFTKEMISSSDYYIKVGKTNSFMKDEIENNLKSKFKVMDYSFLNKINWNNSANDTYTIFSYINKKFEFKVPFDYLGEMYFNKDSSKMIKYFGINNASNEELNQNVTVLFYNDNSYAVTLETKEDEEVILYYDTEFKDSFEENYSVLKKKMEEYTESRIFNENDELMVPYISINELINYDEVCGKYIKDTNYYIINAVQNVNFELSETGGNMTSYAGIVHSYNSGGINIRYFYYRKPFILFLKEKNSPKPYLAIYIQNYDNLS